MGGIERALSILANEWVERGFNIVYVSCLVSKPFYYLNPKIKVIEPNFERSGGLSNKVFFYPKLVSYIRKEIIKENPDRILSFGDFFNPLLLIACSGLNVPVYISDRTSPDYKFPTYIKILKSRMYPKATGFIAQTTRAAVYKKEQFGDRLSIKVIPNALKEMSITKEKRDKIILYVGRFAWEKAPHYLIEAFAQIKDNYDWRLVMAGSGPLLPQMKILAQELNIGNQVDFLGDVKNVDHLYAKAGIYVLPSVVEGFPNSLCEAMAAGLPSICFDTIPHEDIFINPNMGIVCSELSSKSLAKELEGLIVDKRKRDEIGTNASRLSEYLNIKNIGAQYLEFMKLIEC